MTTTHARSPTRLGHFGPYGGRYVPETLMVALNELTVAFTEAQDDETFRVELDHLLRTYVGRPTALYYAENLTRRLGGAKIYIKREDLAHTGAHKINNAIAQGLLAKRMGKKKIFAETGAGQHGVATATVCAMLGMECTVFMGAEDVRRQSLNVFRMKLLGAKVEVVESGSRTLKDAMNEAIRDWVTNVRDTYYLIGSAAGPHPYPWLVREFQSVIGNEARAQILEAEGRLPDYRDRLRRRRQQRDRPLPSVPAEDASVQLHRRRGGGRGRRHGPARGDALEGHARACCTARSSYLLQDEYGQVQEAHSISRRASTTPASGRSTASYKDSGRAEYVADHRHGGARRLQAALRDRGHHPGARAVARDRARREDRADAARRTSSLLLGLSGRGDKDINTVMAALGMDA